MNQQPGINPIDVYTEQASVVSAIVFIIVSIIILPGLLAGDDRFAQVVLGVVVLVALVLARKSLRSFLQQKVLKRPLMRIDQAGISVGYPGSATELSYTWDQLGPSAVVGVTKLANMSPLRLIAIKLNNPPSTGLFTSMFNYDKYWRIKDGWLLISVVSGKGRHQLSLNTQELSSAITALSSNRVPVHPGTITSLDKLPKQFQPVPM